MIVVTTPTGRVGSAVLQKLIERADGEQTRVIARDASRIADEVREKVDVVEGSSADPAALDRALDGADALFWLVPPDTSQPSAVEYYRAFTRPAVEAIDRHQVGHVVAVSSLGREWVGDAGLLTAAFAMEEVLETSTANIRSLQMPFFMENLLGQASAIAEHGMLPMANSADVALSTVAARDIASAAVELLRDRSWTGREAVAVRGPDDLTPTEMAAVISEVLDRPVSLRSSTPDELAARMTQFGASDGFANDMVGMIRAQDAGIYAESHLDAARTDTSFRQWCEQVLRQAVAS